MTRRLGWLTAGLLAVVLGPPAAAGVRVYEQDGKFLEIGGRIQIQYHLQDPDEGQSVDELFFRRLRPYLAGSVTERWEAKIQFDLGKAEGDNELAVKDAYMRYAGSGFRLTIGNQKPPFSREFLTSSKRQELVERTFVGDHNYGAPDRALGLGADGKGLGGKLGWGAFFGSASIDPDARKLDFDSPVNRDDDFNEGWLVSGRLDLHPLGELEMGQGDFGRGPFKVTVSLAAYAWSNDDDNNTRTAAGVATSDAKPDLDSVEGVELSGGLRGHGFSLDAEYQVVSGDTIDPAFAGGLFRNGAADLDKLALEGGYMVIPDRLEIVLGREMLDADSYETAWERTSVGLNWFWNRHKAKLQVTYRAGRNLDGRRGVDADEAFVQWQLVF